MSQGVHLRKYGVQTDIDFDVYEVDGVDLRTDWSPVQADCRIMKDGGAFQMCDNTAVTESGTYSIILTATEMQFASGVLKLVDSVTKVFLDKVVIIETYGNPSAQHAFDLDIASVAQGADNDTILSSLNIASGAVEADLTFIHGTALTETAGQLAAAFKKFFNVAAPTATALSLPDAIPDAAGGLPVSDAGGLDLDTKLANTNEITAARMAALTDWIDGGRLDLLLDAIPTTPMRGTDSALLAANVNVAAGIIESNVKQILDDATAAITLQDWLGKGIRLTADSGTTTTLVDAGLTQADDYWNGALLIFRTGTNIGRTAIVTDFDAASDTLTFTPAMPDAVTTEGFALIPGLGWSDVRAISGDVTAADKLEAMLDGMTTGAVETSGSNSSTQVQTDLAETSNDHYDVMTILFTSGAEAGQSRLITGYTGASGTVAWNAALTGTPADGVTFIILAAGTTADAVWDEILTGASHNINNSAGKRLRQIEEAFVHANGVINTVTDGHTFTLDAGAVAIADYYVGDRLQLVEGTGAGQSRIIVGYTSGKVVTLDSNFTTNPDTSTLYEINAADVHVSLSDVDQAQGFVATYTNTTTITLDAAAVATTDYYKNSLIVFTHGMGAGQIRRIKGYTSGRVVTMSPALVTALDTTTVWHIQAVVSAAEIVDEWETQSQVNPTGFHVNVKEVNATAQTANDNGADINAIKAITDVLPDSGALTTIGTDTARLTAVRAATLTDWINGGRLDLLLDAIPANPNIVVPDVAGTAATLHGITNGKVDTVQADLDILTGSDGVNLATSAITALWAKAMSDLAAGAPSATVSVLTAINYIFEVLRNKSETTGSEISIFKDDGATKLMKSLISDDDTTFTKGEYVAP